MSSKEWKEKEDLTREKMIDDIFSTVNAEEEIEEKVEQKEEKSNEEGEDLKKTKKVIEQETLLMKILEVEGRADDWINWEEKLIEYEKEKKEREKEREAQREKKNRKKENRELMHLCINTIREESNDWKESAENR